MKIISCDVGWSEKGKRNAVAIATSDGQVTLLKCGLSDSGLISLISENSEPGSLILLDIPIEGCENLEVPRRPIEQALQHTVSIYPARMAKKRGKQLKDNLIYNLDATTRRTITIQEIYPYVIYKFLWYLNNKSLMEFHSGQWGTILNEGFLPSKSPPKYKGSIRYDERVEGMRYLYAFITQNLGLRFIYPLACPDESSSRNELEHLADLYDACLGAAIGYYCTKNNPYGWLCGNKQQGEMLLLADEWLKTNLEKYGVDFRYLYPFNTK